LQGGQKDKPEYELKEVAHSQSLHMSNLRKALRLRVLKLSQNNNILRQPPKGELQGGQKDKPDQMFKEVAHSQSLRLTNLHKALRLRVLKLSQHKISATGPSPLGGSCLGDCHALHVRETARHHGHLLRITCLQQHATTDVCFASPLKRFHTACAYRSV